MMNFFCKVAAKVLQVCSRVRDTIVDIYLYFKNAISVWLVELPYIWRGFTFLELWKDIKLTCGSLVSAFITSMRLTKAAIFLRQDERMMDVQCDIYTTPFSWARVHSFLTWGKCYA
jgi:hypothetical protein